MKSRPVIFAIGGLAIGALVVLLIVSIVQTRALAGQIRQTQKVNTGTVRLIRDCTEPSGKCYKRGQHQTAQAVGNINRVVVLAAACADQPNTQTATAIEACVLARLRTKP